MSKLKFGMLMFPVHNPQHDPTVQLETVAQGLSAGLFASSGTLAFNRFTGPGRVGLQSMYLHTGTGADDAGNQGGGSVAGSIIGAILKNS